MRRTFFFLFSVFALPALAANYNVSLSVGTGTTTLPTASTWTGKTGDGKFSTAGNWWGGAVPNSTKTAIFDSHFCSTHCDVTMDAAVSVQGLILTAAFPGTLTQSAGVTVTIGSSGWSQAGGSFVGSSSGDAITMNGSVTLTGGSFKATSGTMTVVTDWRLSGSTTFNANSGLFQMQGACSSYVFIPGTVTYNNVSITASCATYNFSGGTMSIQGNLTLNSGSSPSLTNGTLNVYGNLTLTSGTSSGSAVIQMAGNIAGQTVTGAAGTRISNLTIAAGGNNVTFSGTISIGASYIVASVGTLTTTGSALVFGGFCSSVSVTPGTALYNDITFVNSCFTYDLGGGTMNVGGTLSLKNGTVNNGIFKAYGNVDISGTGTSGSAQLQLVGTSSTTVNASASFVPYGNVTINKTGGAGVTLAGAVSWNGGSQSTTLTAGTIDMAGFAMTVHSLALGGNTLTKNGGTLTVNGSVAATGSLYGGTVAP